MIEIFHLAFAICLLANLSRNGEGLILLAKVVTIINSIRDKSPRQANQLNRSISVEYKFGRRTYCVLIPMKEPIEWTHCVGCLDGIWTDETSKIKFYAGPYNNFHSLPLRLVDINPNYELWAFRFRDGSIIHIQPNDIVVSKLKSEHARVLQLHKQNTSGTPQ